MDVDGFDGEVCFYKINCPIHTTPGTGGIPLLAGNQYSLLSTIQKDAKGLCGGEVKFSAIKSGINTHLLNDVNRQKLFGDVGLSHGDISISCIIVKSTYADFIALTCS